MCFIISIVGLVMAFNFFMASKLLLAGISVAVSAFFIYLMVQNIRRVKKIKEEKNNDN